MADHSMIHHRLERKVAEKTRTGAAPHRAVPATFRRAAHAADAIMASPMARSAHVRASTEEADRE